MQKKKRLAGVVLGCTLAFSMMSGSPVMAAQTADLYSQETQSAQTNTLAVQTVPENKAETKQELKIATLSDTHYLSPDLIKDTDDFTKALNSDRKVFVQSDAFLKKHLEKIKEEKPDILLISGDLTKDGELECHQALAKILENFEKETGIMVFICPGNHDLNNKNGKNFNTPNGKAVDAGRTTQAKYRKIYKKLIYDDPAVTDVYTPPAGRKAGGLSYVARPKKGFTLISIDSARYSADNTESGEDEHETSGQVSKDLRNWVVGQIKAARERGDTVIGMEHHGMIPHFSMEPDVLPMYLVNDYEDISREYANAGMSYIFTGHMHANDVTSMKTDAGNTMYDIETGSVLTYPSPDRIMTLKRTIKSGKSENTVSETLEYDTNVHLNAGTYYNAQTGKNDTISDMTEYERPRGITEEMLPTAASEQLADTAASIIRKGGIRRWILNYVNTMRESTNMTTFKSFDDMIMNGLPTMMTQVRSDAEIKKLTNDGKKMHVFHVNYRKENNKKIYDEKGILLFYDIAPNCRGLSLDMELFIPMKRVKILANAVCDLIDEKLKDPSQLEDTITALVSDVAAIKVVDDKNTAKKETLTDYANYVYQKHLGGEDYGSFDDWAAQTTQKLQNGGYLDEIIDKAVTDLSPLIEQLLKDLNVRQTTGIEYWDNHTNLFESADNSCPVQIWDNKDKTSYSAISFIVGGSEHWSLYKKSYVGWDVNNYYRYVPEDQSWMDLIRTYVKQNGPGSNSFKDIKSSMLSLVDGSKSDHSDGLVNDKTRGKIIQFALAVVDSMSNDKIITDGKDNKNTLTAGWKFAKKQNEFTQAIDMNGWTYGQEPALPVAEVKYGTAEDGSGRPEDITYTYYSDKECTQKIETPTARTPAGTYYVKAFAAQDENLHDTIESEPAEFIIEKADNEWTTEPAITGWKAGETASEPQAAAKFENAAVTFKYYSDAACTEEIAQKPETAGTYYMKAVAAETTNYKELDSEAIAFTISPADTSETTQTETQQPETEQTETNSSAEQESPDQKIESSVQQLLSTRGDKDPAGSAFSLLRLRARRVTKKSIKVQWTAVKGAKIYVVFGNCCGRKYRKLAETSGRSLNVKKAAGKKLKKGTYYKFFVAAFDADGNRIAASKTIHVATKGGKRSNYKAVKLTNVKKNRLTLKKGESFKIQAKAIRQTNKLSVSRHRKMAYESSDPAIAKVSKNGRIRALRKGRCYIYVYTQSGTYKRFLLRVK